MALATVGFRTSFGGHQYLVVALIGTVAGGALGYLTVKLSVPVVVATAAALALFVGLGAAAVPHAAFLHALPTPGVVRGLLDGAVRGWVHLMTTLPPAGPEGDLLAIPYLCGFAGGLLAVVAALRLQRWPACLVPPTAVLLAAVLVGTHFPASVVLQGGVFGALALAWVSIRAGRRGRLTTQMAHLRRHGKAVPLLAATTCGALLLGPHLPLASGRSRFVLRDHLVHFDPSQYPSPLVSYRAYAALKTTGPVLLTVSGLPADTRIRLAAMDGYDDLVWGVTGDGSSGSGTFERVATELPGPFKGSRAKVTFGIGAIGALAGVWVPLVGGVESLQFAGPRATRLGEAWRFNRAIQTGAVTIGLQSGDQYTIDAAISPDPGTRLHQAAVDPGVVLPPLPDLPPAIKSLAADIVSGQVGPWQQANKLEGWFQSQGFYSDGGPGVAPGHSLARLEDFVVNKAPVGDAEQFASAMALLARAIGLPARVVMGFRSKGNSTVELHGGDIDAWVEIAFDGYGWVPFTPSPSRDKVPDQKPPAPQQRIESNAQPVPPPVVETPPPLAGQGHTSPGATTRQPPPPGSAIPPWLAVAARWLGPPVFIVTASCLVIVGLKSVRRKRRRLRGQPAQRVAGAWREVLDYALDLGRPVPPKATRLEAAHFLDVPAARELAEETDSTLFGAEEPDEASAHRLWHNADEARGFMAASVSWRDRMRAAVSPTSLRVTK
jgi:transglutaminase-like putative cysteine protease